MKVNRHDTAVALVLGGCCLASLSASPTEQARQGAKNVQRGSRVVSLKSMHG
jgi:hypothetical protein